MKKRKQQVQRGFTLIELVVVIALLGILAAFAIPRFASLEREARIATNESVAGSLRSAAAMAHSIWLAQGLDPLSMEGNAIDVTNGYPDAADVAATLADTTGYVVTVNGAGDAATFARSGAPGQCQVTYNDALVGAAPVIAVDPSGC
ncbi:MAG TPA: type II secretion system protein [Woeseiaceae bacterium]|nr:type II secretion system protein [Woeseiaceae bacterium]